MQGNISELQARLMRCCAFVCLLTSLSPNAWATVYYQTSLEGVPCNHEINDELVDGRIWDTGQNTSAGSAFPFPNVRCTVAPPTGAGTRYLEILTKCVDGYDSNGRCNSSSVSMSAREDHNSTSAFIDIPLPSTAVTSGKTYYLGAFVRYSRVNGYDQWVDTGMAYDWDKTLEFRGSNFRWGLGVGWIESMYQAKDGKFTFDLWCADTAFVGCQTSNNPGHKIQNASGYNSSNPFSADYDKWYAVVIEVFASATTSGYAKLYVNGINIVNRTGQVTYASGATITNVEMYGTLGQIGYQRAPSLLQMDRIIFTDTLADIVSAGLMSDPTGNVKPPAAPSNVMVN